MKKLLTLLAFAFTIHTNAQICFTANDSFLVSYLPSGICTADFNKDGKADIATTNNNWNNVSLDLGMGNGAFSIATNFDVGGSPTSVTTADFNGDGNPDIATSNTGPHPNISILLGDGAGSFATATDFTLTNGPLQIINADFNGDGKVDLATLDSNNTISVLIGNGTGNFSVTNFSITSQSPIIISTDYDGDGKTDLVTIASAYPAQASVFLSTGAGTFSAPTSYSLNPGTCYAMASADVNADGKMDLITANYIQASISVLLGNGSGGFNTAVSYQGTQYATSIAVADYDGDGKLDVATSGYDHVDIFIGDGAGGFTNTASFVTSTTSGNKAIVSNVDFNNDGRIDIAAINPNNSSVVNIYILLNFSVQTISVTATPAYVCQGSSSVLTATGSTQYVWSTGATTNTISVAPSTTTTYSVSDGTSCTNTTTITINVGTPAIPNICVVTTDSASNYNYNTIYWDKTPYNNVDSFIIYRKDVLSASYLRIGAVSKHALSAFTDTAFSIGGPNGGNPQYSSWSYKLAIKDTCGNIGALSPYHQTMFVQQNSSNFSWNAYTVETGQTNPLLGYAFLRDDNNTGAWHTLVNTTNNSATDPSFASYPNGNWRIDALGFNCTPTQRLAGGNNVQSTYSKSHSNTSKPLALGIKQANANNSQINIYPNPSNGNFVVETNNNQNQTLQIVDVNGKLVLSQNINGTTNIDASNLSNGVYSLNIGNNQGTVNKKLVIVR